MKNFYAFKNVDSAEEAEISIYDEIGFWGTMAKDFHAQLKNIKAGKIKVHINSPGGSVVDGYAIYNMLRAHAADVHVVVDGIAASIASVIAMAGDTIEMPENALMFVHNPLVYTGGNADELRKVADDLDKLGEGIMTIYEARTGMDRKALKKLMDEETLITAKEAVEMGFADTLLPENRAAARYKAEDYFASTVVDRIKAAQAEKQIPPAKPAGGQQQPKPDNKMSNKFATQAEAEARVVVLEGEANAAKTATEQAVNNARQTAITAENKRKTDIKAIADKYNKDGDLNDVLLKALAGDTTAEAFKDEVMAIVTERPAKAAIKQGGGENKGDFATRYKACKTAAERMALVRENRAEARAYERQQRIEARNSRN